MIVSGGYENRSGGLDCQCRYCVHMEPSQRMTRGLQIHEQRRRAGQIRAAQPSAALARSKGFQTVMERRPDVLRWLHKKVKSHNRRVAGEQGMTPAQYRKKRLEQLHELYSSA